MTAELKYFWKKKSILSFIAVFFVVIIHNSATNQYPASTDFISSLTYFIRNLFAYGIGEIAVPFFFFVSGLTMFRNFNLKDYPRKIKSRFKSLVIPYLIWNILGLLFAILYTYTPLSNFISGRTLFNGTITDILEGIFLYKYNFQFWFLYDLIFYSILAPIIYFMVQNKYLSLIFGLVVLCLPLLNDHFLHINLYFTIFYYIGCFVGKHYLEFFSSAKNKSLSITAGAVFSILLVIKLCSIYNLFNLPVIISQLILITTLLSFLSSYDFTEQLCYS